MESKINTIEKPDRRRFERIISDLNEKIKERDDEYKKLRGTNGGETEDKDSANEPGQIIFWLSETSRFKAEKETMRNELRSVIAQIETLQQELKAKKEEISRIESNLYYRDENKLIAYLRRLEDQYSNMQTKNAREENVLINEINKAKRSQKQLVKWRKLVLDREEMTKTLTDLKSQKNTLYRSCKSAKSSEGDSRIKERQCKSRAQALGKELDELYNEKRNLVLSYEQDRKRYSELAQQKKQQKVCRRTASNVGESEDFWAFAGHSKQQVKRTLSHKSARKTFSNDENSSDSDDGEYELFFTEKQICRNLISYLQSFLCESAIIFDDCSQESSKSEIVTTPENPPAHNAFETIAKKDDSDEEGKPFPGQTTLKQLKKRHSRKEKRRLTHSIPLAPNIFSDFERVGLKAPVNYNEVSIVLDKLKDKLKYYEDQTLLPLNFSYTCDKYPYATSESELTMDSSRFSILSLSEAADESPLRNFSQNSFLDTTNNEYSSSSFDDNSALGGGAFNRGRPLRLSSGIECDRPPIAQLVNSALNKNFDIFKTPAIPLRIHPARSLSMDYLPSTNDHVTADSTNNGVLKRRRFNSLCPMVVSKYRNRVSLIFDEGFLSKESST